MGQKKTWALHHVPYSMLWDNMSLDYSHQWLPILQSPLSSFYSSAVVDYHFKQSMFTFVWKSQFMAKSLTTRQFCTRSHGQILSLDRSPAPVFSWTVNSNRGTNETMIAKSYLIKMHNSTTLLNFFFRADFFEQKGKTKLRAAPKALATLAEPVRQEMHKRVRQLWPSVRLSSRRSTRVARKSVVSVSLEFTFGQKNGPFRNLQYSKQLNTRYFFRLSRRRALGGLKKFSIYHSPSFIKKLRANKLKRYSLYARKPAKTHSRHPARALLKRI